MLKAALFLLGGFFAGYISCKKYETQIDKLFIKIKFVRNLFQKWADKKALKLKELQKN